MSAEPHRPATQAVETPRGRGWRAVCSCSWTGRTWLAEHDAQSEADDHAARGR